VQLLINIAKVDNEKKVITLLNDNLLNLFH